MAQDAIGALHSKHKLRPTDENSMVVRFADNEGHAAAAAAAAPAAQAPAFQAPFQAFPAQNPYGFDPYGMNGVNPYAAFDPYGAMAAAAAFSSPPPPPGMAARGMAAGSEPKLFVGNLPGNTTDADLRMLFQTYGPVEEVHLMNPSAKTGQRCAFVKYPGVENCQAAIDGLVNYRVMPGDEKPILVRFADSQGKGAAAAAPAIPGSWQPPPAGGAVRSAAPPAGVEPKLFVGNLPASTTEADLQLLFATYGQVEDVHLMNPSAKTGQRCAFVRYSSTDACQSAIDGLVNYSVAPGESPVLVRFADSQTQKRPRMF